MVDQWNSGPVPPEWRGLWRRLALERADGTADTDSLVLWLQTDSWFVDLRIPADRHCKAHFVTDHARQEGFAGRLHHAGNTARWERTVDFRPLGQPDEGTLRRDRRMMTEYGLHDPYVEHWWLEADGETETLVATDKAVAVRVADHLMIAVERRPAAPSERLLSAVRTADDLTPLLDCEISHAIREPGGWRIAASTLPWREGAALSARELHSFEAVGT